MNPTSPLSPSLAPLQSAAGHAASEVSGSLQTAREKLKEFGQATQEKIGEVGHKAGEAVQAAREKMEGAGTSLLQWTRENPSTALATFFVSGLVLGAAVTMQRHEKTFAERLRDDSSAAFRDATSRLRNLWN